MSKINKNYPISDQEKECNIEQNTFCCYKHCRSYIQQKSNKFDSASTFSERSRELMKQSGFNNFELFQTQRREWNNCNKEVPEHYFDALEIDIATLHLTLQLDQAEYECESSRPWFPDHFLIDQDYSNKKIVHLPKNTSEKSAIEIILYYSRKNTFRQSWLIRNGIKTLHFNVPEGVMVHLHKPGFVKIKNLFIFNGEENYSEYL